MVGCSLSGGVTVQMLHDVDDLDACLHLAGVDHDLHTHDDIGSHHMKRPCLMITCTMLSNFCYM